MQEFIKHSCDQWHQPLGKQRCGQYNGHIPSSHAEGDSVCHVTGWKWTICIQVDGNTPPVNSSWNKAPPYSQVTLCCAINLGYSIGKGEPQEDVHCEKVCRRASLQERRLQKSYPISVSALNQKYTGQSSSLRAHSSTLLIFLCSKVLLQR